MTLGKAMSSGIRFSGLGSGFDIDGIVNQLLTAEKVNLDRIKDNQNTVKTKLSIYGVIQSSFSSLRDATKNLSNLESIDTKKVVSTDATKVTASATNSATNGSYSVSVSQLAQSQRLATASAFTSADSIVGTGNLTIAIGKYDSGTQQFTTSASQSPVTISITPGQSSLRGVRDAINAANAGVTASIVNDGSGFRLSIVSQKSGEENTIKMTVSDGTDGIDTDTSGLSQLAFDPALANDQGKNLRVLQNAQNAIATIDGIPVTKATNTFNDVIEGVNLTLNQVTTSPVKIDVSNDSAALKTTIDGFVKAYNDVRSKLMDQQTKGATLASETAPGALMRQLRSVVSKSLGTSNTQLADIGLSFDRTGVLSFNNSKFNSALEKDPLAVAKVFSDQGVTTDSRVSFVSSTAKTLPGTYSVAVSFDGNPLEGSLNGQTAVGTQTTLQGATGNSAEGLVVKIAAGALGGLGTVTFSRGIASMLTGWIDGLKSDGGTLASRETALNAQLTRLNTSETRESDRLDLVEKRLRTQYASLDSMLSRMRQTSSFLSQRLAGLQ